MEIKAQLLNKFPGFRVGKKKSRLAQHPIKKKSCPFDNAEIIKKIKNKRRTG